MLGHVRLWKQSKQGRGKAARARIEKTGNAELLKRFDSLQQAVSVEDDDSPPSKEIAASPSDDLTLNAGLVARTTPPVPMAKVRAKAKAKAKGKESAAPHVDIPKGTVDPWDAEHGFAMDESASPDYAIIRWADGIIFSKPNQFRYRVWRGKAHHLGALDVDVSYKTGDRGEALGKAKTRILGAASGQSKPKAAAKAPPGDINQTWYQR